MAEKPLASPEVLRQLLRYEPETGKLFWKARTPEMFSDKQRAAKHACSHFNSRFAGKEAFTTINDDGYHHSRIFGRMYKAHRVVWAIVTGEWPADQIDHINGIPTDNRFENLRPVTGLENCKNKKTPSSNTSGVIGVSWDKTNKKWKASIRVDGHRKHIGTFDNFLPAVAARKAEEVAHGFHENHGRAARAIRDKIGANDE